MAYGLKVSSCDPLRQWIQWKHFSHQWKSIKGSGRLAQEIPFLTIPFGCLIPLGSGSSGSKCSETYRGPSAISELESKALDDLLKGLGSRLKGYIDFQSYSQMWLTPWGYTYSQPPDYDEQVWE